jgi:hypothetical protein
LVATLVLEASAARRVSSSLTTPTKQGDNMATSEPKIMFQHEVVDNSITLNCAETEMLRITRDGFYVRGVAVDQDTHEAQQVYEAFKQWMEWTVLSGR